MAIATYDSKQVLASWGEIPITGYADGSFIKIEYDEDAYTKYIGASGEGGRARNANRGGKVTITLAGFSQTNDAFSGAHAEDLALGGGSRSFFLKDASGRTLAVAQNAWVMKAPATEFGKEISTREWVLDSDFLELFIGGN